MTTFNEKHPAEISLSKESTSANVNPYKVAMIFGLIFCTFFFITGMIPLILAAFGQEAYSEIDSEIGKWAAWIAIPVISAAAGIFLVLSYKKSKKREVEYQTFIESLPEGGQKICGTIYEIEYSGNEIREVDGRDVTDSYYIVRVVGKDNNGVDRYFDADDIVGLGDIEDFDFQNNPVNVDVYIDPNNPNKNYKVDLSNIDNIVSRISGKKRQNL